MGRIVSILYIVTHVSVTHHQGGGGTADGTHMHAMQAQMNAAMLAGWAHGVGAGMSINESCRVYEGVCGVCMNASRHVI